LRASAPRPRFTVTKLPGVLLRLFPAESGTLALNDRGDVVACVLAPWREHRPATVAEPSHEALLYRNGKATPLGTFGGDFSEALGVNDLSVVVGWAYVRVPQFRRRAFIWQNGKMNPLRNLPDKDLSSEAVAINNKGQVAGSLEPGKKQGGAAFIWQDGKVTLLQGGRPNDINDEGVMVGRTADFESSAVVWRNGRAISLPVPKGGGWIRGRARSVNNQGVIVGTAERKTNFPQTEVRALLWKDGVVTVLPTLTGKGRNAAADINNKGDVVGDSGPATGGQLSHAFLFSNGVMRDLNECIAAGSGWVLTYASGINDKGQIVGWGHYRRQHCAFLLTPVR
jgi:probable HAF family extracellular repeat protein